MLKFKFPGIVPRGGRYMVEAHGREFNHPEKGQLKRQVELYCEQNKLPVPDGLDALIEDCTCRRQPVKFCIGHDDGKPRKQVVTLSTIRSSTRALLSGEGFADPGMALERAVICASCKLNDRSACPTCTGLIAWGTREIGNREVPGYSDVLGVCELDGSLMSAGIFAKAVSANPGEPAHCWRGRL